MPDGRYRLILGHSKDRRYCYYATAEEAREAVEEVILKARSDDYWRDKTEKAKTEKAIREKPKS